MMALTLFFSLIPPTEYRAELELRALVCAFLGIVGAASLYGGYWLFANGGRAPRYNTAVAMFFTGFGALLIALVFMLTLGPWRHREPDVFPARIVDLRVAPAAVERAKPLLLPRGPRRVKEPHRAPAGELAEGELGHGDSITLG